MDQTVSVLERHVMNNDVENLISASSEMVYKVISHPYIYVSFQGCDLAGNITYDETKGLIYVHGRLPEYANTALNYIAAAPIHRNYSYAWSGLPYPNPEVAYGNTPNKGVVEVDHSGEFKLCLLQPSAYYVRQSKILLDPHVYINPVGTNQLFTITVSKPVPNRSLTSLPDRPNRTEPRS